MSKKKRDKYVDYRKGKQTEKGQKSALNTAWVLNVSAALSCFVMLFTNATDKIGVAFGLAVAVMALVIYAVFPQYFSLFGDDVRRKYGYKTKAHGLSAALLLPCFTMTIKTLIWFEIENGFYLVWLTVGGAAVLLLIIFALSRELRNMRPLWVAVVLAVLCCSIGLAGQLNHVFNTKNDCIQGTVVETEMSGYSGATRKFCYCKVRTESGEMLSLPMNVLNYVLLDAGDSVLVYKGSGALRMDYACFIRGT